MGIRLSPPVAQRRAVFTDASTENNTIQVVPTAAKSASTSTGGAINVNNTGNTGAGVVIYSNLGATASGRMFVVRTTNAAFDQQGIYLEYAGTNHGLVVSHAGTGTASLAASITSTNASDTAVGITGSTDGRGVVKVTHNKSGTDTNASLISLLANGSGTACQGIFFDTASGVTTTGDLLNFRQNGTEVFNVDASGRVKLLEGADPSAPSTNEAILYARDSGGGKTQLCVRFATGAVQVLATEP